MYRQTTLLLTFMVSLTGCASHQLEVDSSGVQGRYALNHDMRTAEFRARSCDATPLRAHLTLRGSAAPSMVVSACSPDTLQTWPLLDLSIQLGHWHGSATLKPEQNEFDVVVLMSIDLSTDDASRTRLTPCEEGTVRVSLGRDESSLLYPECLPVNVVQAPEIVVAGLSVSIEYNR